MSAALTDITYGDVKASVETAKTHLEAAAEQVVWQIENRVWTVLGYADWNEMREGEYGGAAFMVPRAERPELVARMRHAGLTQQEVADTAGIAPNSVRKYERKVNAQTADSDEDATPIITNSRGQQRPSSYAPRYSPEADVAEFPVLAYYVETGRSADVEHMAADLRRYRDRGELSDRMDTLRRSIAVDKAKRDGTYRPAPAVNTETGEVANDYDAHGQPHENYVPDATAGDEPPVPRPVASAANHCPTCTCTQGEN